MTIELRLLAYSVALLFVLVLIQATYGVLAQGPKAMGGPRDHLKEPSLMQARTKRLVDNHREGLILFAPLILIAALTNVSNEWTVLGARLFLYARIAHAIIYLAGWPTIRVIAWLVGIVGTIMIFFAVLGVPA